MSKINQYIVALLESPVLDFCPVCLGDRTVEVDVPVPHSFGRDVGYLSSEEVDCEDCSGSGRVQRFCEECDNEIYAAYINRKGSVVVNDKRQKLCETCINEKEDQNDE